MIKKYLTPEIDFIELPLEEDILTVSFSNNGNEGFNDEEEYDDGSNWN